MRLTIRIIVLISVFSGGADSQPFDGNTWVFIRVGGMPSLLFFRKGAQITIFENDECGISALAFFAVSSCQIMKGLGRDSGGAGQKLENAANR